MREQWGPGVASLSEAAAPGWSLKQMGMSFPVPWKTCWKKFSYHLSFLLKLCASKQIYLLLCITVVQKRNKFSGEKHRTDSWTGVRQEVTRWWSWVHWLYDHVRVISKEMKRNIISFPFGPWGWSTRNRTDRVFWVHLLSSHLSFPLWPLPFDRAGDIPMASTLEAGRQKLALCKETAIFLHSQSLSHCRQKSPESYRR